MTEEKLLAEMERLKQGIARPGATLEDKKRFIEVVQRILENRGDEHCIQLRGTSAHHVALCFCAAAFNTTYFEQMRKHTPRPEARRLGQAAWLSALPPLTGAESIGDFIACVGYGIANDIIAPEKGARLLYAAQVAQSNQRVVQKHEEKRETRRRGPYRKGQESDPAQDPDTNYESSPSLMESIGYKK